MIKYIDDYVDDLKKTDCKIYDKSDIKRVLKYVFKQLYNKTVLYHDVEIRNSRYRCAIGKGWNGDLDNIIYHKKKYKRKLHFMWGGEYKEYDGYYYAGMTEKQFIANKKRIENNQTLTLKRTCYYKIPDEVFDIKRYTHFIKISYPFDSGYSMYKSKFKTSCYKYIARKDESGNIIFV